MQQGLTERVIAIGTAAGIGWLSLVLLDSPPALPGAETLPASESAARPRSHADRLHEFLKGPDATRVSVLQDLPVGALDHPAWTGALMVQLQRVEERHFRLELLSARHLAVVPDARRKLIAMLEPPNGTSRQMAVLQALTRSSPLPPAERPPVLACALHRLETRGQSRYLHRVFAACAADVIPAIRRHIAQPEVQLGPKHVQLVVALRDWNWGAVEGAEALLREFGDHADRAIRDPARDALKWPK